MDTLLIEVGRLNRVIRRLRETAGAGGGDRERTITQLMHRIVEIFEAIDALGAAQGGEGEPTDGE